MTAPRQRSRQRRAKNCRRHGSPRRRGRWSYRIARLSLPARRERALDQIEQTLMMQDPHLGLTFAVFTRLTQDEAMPATEHLAGRLQQILRPVIMLPFLVTGLIALLAAGWLLPVRPGCPPGPETAAHAMPPASLAARCQPGPPAKLSQMPQR